MAEAQLKNILKQISNAVRRGESIDTPEYESLLSRLPFLIASSGCDISIKCTLNPLRCVLCTSFIPKSIQNFSIRLQCNSSHLICSVKCLKNYALQQTNNSLLELEKNVICPACKSSIDYNLLNRFFETKIPQIQKEAIERALESLLSEEGKEEMKPRFDCQICFSKVKIEDGITLDCNHRICSECIAGHAQSKINSGEVSDNLLYCPFEKCTEPLNPYMLKSILNFQLYEKYDKLRTDRCEIRLQDDEMVFRCPSAECSFFLIMPKDTDEYVCIECNYKCCPKCGREVHKGATCEAYENWRLENSEADKRSEDFFRQNNFVKCPTCGAVVEKVSGCNYMRCYSPSCQGRNSFCFLCGRALRSEGEGHNCAPI